MIINKKQYSPNEVFGENISDDKYEGLCKGYNIPYDNTLNKKWFVYSFTHCLDEGLDIYRANSFGHIMALYLSGLGHSCGTEIYFLEELLEYKIIDLWNSYEEELSEKEKIKNLFNDMFILYKDHIEDYTINNQRLQIRCSITMLTEFENVDGETKKEKMLNLLNIYKKNYKDYE